MLNVFKRFSQGLTRTREKWSSALGQLFLGKKTIDQALLDDLDTLLLTADIGIETTEKILAKLTQKLKRDELKNPEQLSLTLKQILTALLAPVAKPLTISHGKTAPFVLLVVGINGSGKTTTIGKLAKQFQKQGLSVMLAAGDTFRAAAIEQLQTWGVRNNVPVVAQHQGADSASVIFDAFNAAKAKKIDILIADTAGRLHTQHHLMAELSKVSRVMKKLDENAPHETLLVLDAGIGQNALQQAKTFHEHMQLTGLVMTKLDGTAKGGILFTLADQLALPIRFLGLGEGIDDLKPFDAENFVEALFHD